MHLLEEWIFYNEGDINNADGYRCGSGKDVRIGYGPVNYLSYYQSHYDRNEDAEDIYGIFEISQAINDCQGAKGIIFVQEYLFKEYLLMMEQDEDEDDDDDDDEEGDESYKVLGMMMMTMMMMMTKAYQGLIIIRDTNLLI
ncbi:MAG: hypothetical protein EZS28_045314, partial [Streblomastix strix]